jgi:hypothetical protein
MVMKQRLRLERRVVPDGDGAIGLVAGDGGGRFGHGHDATNALVRDAGVGSLEPVPDADMTTDIVRQNLQQPHGVHCIAEFLSKARHVVAGRAEQGKEIIIVPVIPAARSGKNAAAIVERRHCVRRQRVAMPGDSGLLQGGAGGVETEQVGAQNAFVQLAIIHQRAVVHLRDLRCLAGGPAPRIPAPDLLDGGTPLPHRLPDGVRAQAAAAHRAAAGNHHFAGGDHDDA